MLADRLSKEWTERRVSAPVEALMRFTNEGLVLGAGTVLAPVGGSLRDIRVDPGEPRLLALLTAAHARAPTAGALNHLRRAADAWRRGEDTLAAMHLALSGLDRLQRPGADAHRLFLADSLLKSGVTAAAVAAAIESAASGHERLARLYNPDQPRVPAGNGVQSGRWTSGDFGSAEPKAEVNPSTVTPVVRPPVGSFTACQEALSDCYWAATVAARKDPPGDRSRFIDYANCKKAGDRCNEISWVVEDLPGFEHAAVIFPHQGVVLIDKGQLDRYLPPLFGRAPPIRRYLEKGGGAMSGVAEGEPAPFLYPPWRAAVDETISHDPAEFGPCLNGIRVFAEKTGGQVADQLLTVSKQWGEIVRAKVVTPEPSGPPTTWRVICWAGPGPGVSICVELETGDDF